MKPRRSKPADGRISTLQKLIDSGPGPGVQPSLRTLRRPGLRTCPTQVNVNRFAPLVNLSDTSLDFVANADDFRDAHPDGTLTLLENTSQGAKKRVIENFDAAVRSTSMPKRAKIKESSFESHTSPKTPKAPKKSVKIPDAPRKDTSEPEIIKNLPGISESPDRFQHPKPPHEAEAQIPADTPHTPLGIFFQFFTRLLVGALVRTTNVYAERQRHLETGSWPIIDPSSARNWTPVTIGEMYIFIGLTLYMGVYSCPCVTDYWSIMEGKPKYPPMERMSRVRFQQIRRYFHISDPSDDDDRHHDPKNWWMKVAPLANHLRELFPRYYLPATNVAVDEMMVAFQGRSKHTVRMPNKPISEGYKIYALCDRGYCVSFLFYSPVGGLEDFFTGPIAGLDRALETEAENSTSDLYCDEGDSGPLPALNLTELKTTSRAVIILTNRLPHHSHRFTVYMDNYFTNGPLFRCLRRRGIGAAGTTRQSSAGFPSHLKIDKTVARKHLDWNFLSTVIDGEHASAVGYALWMDSNVVNFISTVHDFSTQVLSTRRKPKSTSTNAKKTRAEFRPNEHQKSLAIPEFIDDYNHNMGSVDVADQLRSYYQTQLKSARVWMPLWHFLLDTTVVNCWLLAKMLGCAPEGSEMEDVQISQKEFRLQLALALIKYGWSETHPPRLPAVEKPLASFTTYVTVNTPLPPKKQRCGPGHEEANMRVDDRGRQLCWFCRWRYCRLPKEKRQASKTEVWCCKCRIPLCKERGCWTAFHCL